MSSADIPPEPQATERDESVAVRILEDGTAELSRMKDILILIAESLQRTLGTDVSARNEDQRRLIAARHAASNVASEIERLARGVNNALLISNPVAFSPRRERKK